VYDERADATAIALRAAGARRVFLAGRRETEGVDDLIYVGCNAVDVLDRALTAALDDRSAE
jgi:methylmalonyl-CoA mutase